MGRPGAAVAAGKRFGLKGMGEPWLAAQTIAVRASYGVILSDQASAGQHGRFWRSRRAAYGSPWVAQIVPVLMDSELKVV